MDDVITRVVIGFLIVSLIIALNKIRTLEEMIRKIIIKYGGEEVEGQGDLQKRK